MALLESQVWRELRILIENPKDQKFTGFSDNYVKVIVNEGFEELSNKILEGRPEYGVGQWVRFHN